MNIPTGHGHYGSQRWHGRVRARPRAQRVCFNPSALRVRVEEAELPLPKKVGLDEGGEGREEVDGGRGTHSTEEPTDG